MRTPPLVSFALAALVLWLAGCAQRSLPAYEPPVAKSEYQHVRTTAYFDGEADHLCYTNHNALGTTLQFGQINSAAADWSRWPAGTMFRIAQTGRTYVVDDYGWDLAGRNTIDLYMPTRALMDRWGVQHVDIQILQWGDPHQSYATLLPRSHFRHVERMLKELRPELDEPMPALSHAPYASQPPQMAIAPVPVPPRQTYASHQTTPSGVALQPFTY